MRTCLAGVTGLLALAGCASTVEAPPQNAVPDETAGRSAAVGTSDPDRVVCVGEVRTGSRMRREPVCKTQREWDRIADRDARELDELRNNSGGTAENPFQP